MSNCTEYTALPSTRNILRHGSPPVVLCLILASLLCAASLILTRNHVLKIKSRTPTRRRDLYVDIVRVGVVFCITGAISMFVPRAFQLFDVAQSFYEARVLYDFGFLLINYIAGENVHDPREAKRKCLQILGALPERRYLAVPPFGLCFRWGPFGKPHQFTRPTIRLVIRCLKQFLFIGPSIAVIVLFFELANDELEGRPDLVVIAFRGIATVSILAAVWGLFIMYGATRKILSNFNTTQKFVAIKGMLLITGTQELLISSYIKASIDDDDGRMFTTKFYARFYSCFAVCVEGFVMTLLLIYAFPAIEVEPDYATSSISIAADLLTSESYNTLPTETTTPRETN